MSQEEIIKLICITCPKGCTLEVQRDGDTVLKVDQGCKRGHEYAQRELVDPRRMVSSTVKISGGPHPLLPVYTAEAFPKPRIPELMAALREMKLKAPVIMDQVVLADALGTGIDILASRDILDLTT
jgi:CxxC motif-containing protein